MISDRSEWVSIIARAQADSHWSRADSVVTSTRRLACIATPSSGSALFNNVRLAVLEADGADETIGDVLAGCAGRGSALAWVVGPLCRPLDLGERLVAQGMEPRGASWGMALEVEARPELPPVEGVEVRRIDVDGVGDFVRASERGFGGLPSATFGEDLRYAMAKHPELRVYVAYRGGVPAGSGIMRMFPRCAMLLGSSVDPEHRGRGVYRALLARRVHQAREEGRALVVTVAKAETSGPVCARFGFERVCGFRSFAWTFS